jgi:hypothetical protein
MKLLRILTFCAVGLLAACAAEPDRAMFVTTTKIGVGADAATGKAHVGYDRSEAYIGPAYSDIGALPPVAGSLQSDLDIFAPEIRQTYATGDAALLATRRMTSKDMCPSSSKKDEIEKLTVRARCECNLGCPAGARRLAIFGTNTHAGLSIQAKDAVIASVNFGYGRQELSVLPLNRDPQKPDGSVAEDYYASTLAYINSDVDIAEGGVKPGSKLKLNQFVATGGAADALASTELVRNSFATLAQAGASANANAAVRSLELALTEDEAKKHRARGVEAAERREAQISGIIEKLGLVPNDEVKISGSDRLRIAERLKEADPASWGADEILSADTVGEIRQSLRDDETIRRSLASILANQR